jgi:hypothetical protein
LEQKWIETETTVDTVNWKGEPIKVQKVKAFQDPKTGEIFAYPSEVSKAEINQFAEEIGVCPHDVSTLLMLCVKPGNFNEGDIFYKYHLQKMMFYLWKSLEDVFGDSLPLDSFIAAENGPVPTNLNEDLTRLEKCGLLAVKIQKWNDENKKEQHSKRIMLTAKGSSIATEVCQRVPDIFMESALNVKSKLYPKSPEEVRHLVHKEYPEYRDTYVKNDIE